MRLQFAGRATPGVAIAIDLQVVDSSTWMPIPQAPRVVERMGSLPGTQTGLFESVLRLETQIHSTVGEAEGELRALFGQAREAVKPLHAALLASGTHPVAGWRDVRPSHSPRHEGFFHRLQWVGRRGA